MDYTACLNPDLHKFEKKKIVFEGRKETEQAKVKIKIEARGAIIAKDYTLGPVYPNPFNASFTAPFTLNKSMLVKVSLYNIAGQRVMSVLDNKLSAGDYHF